MALIRFAKVYVCALGLSLALVSAASADTPRFTTPASAHADAQLLCKVYALSDLGEDPHLGKWIAETLPQVVQPGSWSQQGGDARLSYYAPGRVMVVYQSAAAHTEVDAFLKNVKAAMANRPTSASRSTAAMREPGVLPAAHSAFVPAQGPAAKAAQAMPYAVPPPVGQPKHLFHFIIRYEGEGIIDSNVAELYKSMNSAKPGEIPPSLAAIVGVPASACNANPVMTAPAAGEPAPAYMPPCAAPGLAPIMPANSPGTAPIMPAASSPREAPLRSSPVSGSPTSPAPTTSGSSL